MTTQFYLYLIFTIVWFVMMTILSSQRGEHTSQVSMKLSKKLNVLIKTDLNALNGHLRQAAHVVLFAILTILSSLTLQEADLWWIYAVGFCIIWARVDEFKKRWFIGRHDGDTRHNLLGVSLGVVVLIVCISLW